MSSRTEPVRDTLNSEPIVTKPKVRRKHTEWKGQNTILFDGRIIGGPELYKLYRTIALLVIPSLLFIGFVAERFWRRWDSPYVAIVEVLLLILSMVTLVITAFTDPGIIPRNNAGRLILLPKHQDICLDGRTVRLKLCSTCKIIRPPRAFHCPICDNCVERFDHHCPWIGTCIGLRNYGWFSSFIWSTLGLCAFVFAHCLILLLRVGNESLDKRFVERMKYVSSVEPIALVLIIYVFIALCFVIGLCFFHLYLVAFNKTTNEQLRGLHPFGSKYSVGPCRNVQNMCCLIPESAVHIHHKEPKPTKEMEWIQKKTVHYVDSLAEVERNNSEEKHFKGQEKFGSNNEVEVLFSENVKPSFPERKSKEISGSSVEKVNVTT